jgi:hypothetical protein
MEEVGGDISYSCSAQRPHKGRNTNCLYEVLPISGGFAVRPNSWLPIQGDFVDRPRRAIGRDELTQPAQAYTSL